MNQNYFHILKFIKKRKILGVNGKLVKNKLLILLCLQICSKNLMNKEVNNCESVGNAENHEISLILPPDSFLKLFNSDNFNSFNLFTSYSLIF